MQDPCHQLWVVCPDLLVCFFFSLKILDFFDVFAHMWMEMWGGPFRLNGVSSSSTSVCEGILLRARLGGWLRIPHLLGGRCNHLEFLSASVSAHIWFLFQFYFVLLTLTLFCGKKNIIFEKRMLKKYWKTGTGISFFLPVSVSLIHF